MIQVVVILPWDTRFTDRPGARNDFCSWSYLDDAVCYARKNGARIVIMSLSTTSAPCPDDMKAEITCAFEEGVLVVAAGNVDTFPANCHHVLGVSTSDRHDRITHPVSGSGYIDAAAPGGSTYGAAAMFSGLASLELSRYPGYTVDQLAGAILFNAQDIGYQDNWDGYRRIDAYRVMRNGDTPCARRLER